VLAKRSTASPLPRHAAPVSLAGQASGAKINPMEETMQPWIARVAAASLVMLPALLILPALPQPAHAQTALALGYQPTIDAMPAFIAKERGFFTHHGLNVSLTGGSGAIQISGVVAGSLQIGNPTVAQLLQAIDSGLDLVIVAGDNLMSPEAAEFAAVVRSGESLHEPRDFIGRKVAVNTVGAFLHVLFVQWLKNHDVDPARVTFVEVPFPSMNDVLHQGTVDAAIAVEPFVSRMVQAKSGEREDGFVRDFPPGMPVAVYAAERGWATAHHDEVAAFRAALQEGNDFLLAQPAAARADTLKYLKMPPEVMDSLKMPDLKVDLPTDGIAQWVRILRGQDRLANDLDATKLIWR
jgi:NitT/TauT family transport system substrate-binding protein